ncbi:MAG: phosphatidate cytidylyltransferase [Treponema sp.]|jgi:phosphatidate cytidylyltransferase|nr:phosphatidate cytidylyltransferase [Treponema sp.]
MAALIKRLLVFFIGIPLVTGLVLFLPFRHHLPLNIIVIVFSALGAVEFAAMLEKKNLRVTKTEAFFLGAAAPAALTLTISLYCPQWIIPLFLMAGAFWVLLSRVFTSSDRMEAAASQIAAGFSVFVYPGFFMYWLVKMTSLENAGVATFVFLMIVLGSDAAAWLAGTLFGRNNRGIIPASPNKSAAGFIGGIAGSIIVSGGAALIVPAAFAARAEAVPSFLLVTLLGVVTGIAAALGDLAESAIKRSGGVKDSGNLMLGRGGVLDTIDSIAVAAPVFYLLYNALFINP